MYKCCRRFKGEGLAGHFNIKQGEILTVNAIGRLCYKDRAVCTHCSDISHNYFAIDDDGKGQERFALTQAIQKQLNGAKTKEKLKKWDKVMADETCIKYSRKDFDDYFLWSDDFFKADIKDLEYIFNLVKGA